jgi:hypothetical protein
LAACGGGSKKVAKKPKTKPEPVVEKKETEEDRAEKRLKEAHKLVPDGSSCLPVALKEDGAPNLELAANGPDALICAIDTDKDRLLGPVGCWKIDLATGGLTYKTPEPLPGRSFWVKLDEHCARGYCLPKDAKDASTAIIAWDLDGKKVAVLAGDDVHVFDAESKAQESSFSIRGDKGLTNNPTAIYFVGSSIVVEGADDGAYAAAWVFKPDGTALGPVAALGGKEEKPISTYKGSVSILDKGRVGVSDHGMDTLTVYEVDGGKRTKLVRNSKKPACKPAEIDAYWHGEDKVSDKCKGSLEALSGHLVGATVVAGAKNFLALLRGDRLGELGVLDAKTLQEKKAIKMPWCSAEGGEGAADGEKKTEAKDDAKEEKTEKGKTRGASSDPQEGGE